MTYDELSTNIKTQYFYRYQLGRVFPEESRQQINTQLWRWTKRGKLTRLKQGLYLFPDHDLDEFALSALLYQPSYVSLESALNNFGLIPDIALTTTAVNPVTTKSFETDLGQFSYHKLKPDLFFGFRKVLARDSLVYYQVAEAEKAVLDLVYVRHMSALDEIRLDRDQLNLERLAQLAEPFPDWVKSITLDLCL